LLFSDNSPSTYSSVEPDILPLFICGLLRDEQLVPVGASLLVYICLGCCKVGYIYNGDILVLLLPFYLFRHFYPHHKQQHRYQQQHQHYCTTFIHFFFDERN